MNNPVLNAEQMMQAVRNFGGYVDTLQHRVNDFGSEVHSFGQHMTQQIDRLARIEGMKAENQACAALGKPPQYLYGDFANA